MKNFYFVLKGNPLFDKWERLILITQSEWMKVLFDDFGNLFELIGSTVI